MWSVVGVRLQRAVVFELIVEISQLNPSLTTRGLCATRSSKCFAK